MPYLDPIQMAALYDTGNLLHSSLNEHTVLEQATALGLRVMRARWCVCFVLDERRARIKRQTSNDIPLEMLNSLETALEPLLKTARESGQLTHLTSLAAELKWQPFEVGALILAPLKVDDDVLGALYVDRAIDAPPFTDGDLNLCEAYAAQVGLAVRNAKRYQEATPTADFLAILASDLKGPTTAIAAYSQLLIVGVAGQLNEQQMSFAQHIVDATERVINIINDVTTILRIEGHLQLEIKSMNIGDCIAEAIAAIRPRCEAKQQTLTLDIPQALTVLGDYRQVKLILNNLLSNALKYTPEKGEIILRVNQSMGAVRVDVIDNGARISPEELAEIVSYFQAKLKAYPLFHGLGLHIAKGLVQLMGGQIGVESELGKGSTFWFTLPAADKSPTDSQTDKRTKTDGVHPG